MESSDNNQMVGQEPCTMSEDAAKSLLKQPTATFMDPKRIALLRKLKSLFQKRVSPELWSFLWMSDIEMLRKLVQKAEDDVAREYVFLTSILEKGKIIQHWSQRIRISANSATASPKRRRVDSTAATPPGLPSPPAPLSTSLRGQLPSSPLNPSTMSPQSHTGSNNRSRDMAALCRKRDGDKCVITLAGEPIEVAHIYPFSMQHIRDIPNDPYSFWSILRVFWSKERVDAWYQATFSRGTEVVDNLMCLAPHVHKYHERAQFALQPIMFTEDKMRLTVRFWWLPRFEHSDEGVDLDESPSILEKLDHRMGRSHVTKLYNVNTDEKICSGDEICFETSDPESLPLPNFDLLEMQWVLQCVAAMSGGAEPQDETYGGDDDDSFGDVPIMGSDDGYTSDLDIDTSLSSVRSTIPSSLLDARGQCYVDKEIVHRTKTQVSASPTEEMRASFSEGNN